MTDNFEDKPSTDWAKAWERNEEVLIASIAQNPLTIRGRITYVSGTRGSFDFLPSGMAGSMEDLVTREWELFLPKEPPVDIAGKFLTITPADGVGIQGVLYIGQGGGWYTVHWGDGSGHGGLMRELQMDLRDYLSPIGSPQDAVRQAIQDGNAKIVADFTDLFNNQ